MSQRDSDPVQKPRDSAFILVKCPLCDAKLKVPEKLGHAKIKCPKCETALVPQPQPPADKKCSHCGRVVAADVAICVSCGFDFRTKQLLRKPLSAAERLGHLNKKIAKVKAEIRQETKALIPAQVAFFCLFLGSCVAFPFLMIRLPLGGIAVFVGNVIVYSFFFVWIVNSETIAKAREIREKRNLDSLLRKRKELERKLFPVKYWSKKLWVPVTAITLFASCAGVFTLIVVSVSKEDELGRSLIDAIVDHDVARVRLLVEDGAPVNCRSRNGLSPLHFAAGAGKAEIVEILIDADADVSYCNDGINPLDDCVERWNTRDAEAYNKTAVLLVSNGAEFGSTDLPEWLKDSIRFGQVGRVAFLVAHGADVNAVHETNGTPLEQCVRTTTRDVEIAKVLLHAGADPNLTTLGSSPINIAVEDGNVQLATLLLEYGASVQAADGGPSPMEIAIKKGNAEMISLLRTHDAP